MTESQKGKQVVKAVGHALTLPLRILRNVFAVVGLLTSVAIFVAGLYVYSFFREIPDLERMRFLGVKKVAQMVIQERLQDKSKRYRWVELSEVNRDLLFAIVMAEDSEFFEHDGVAVDAMLTSFADNIKKRKIESGGSTITQQTVKNVFLTSERSFKRKLKEILIAKDLEEKLSKNEILEIYLNIAEFGPDILGVNAAAHQYFEKSPGDLNAAEGAFLALMLPSPRRLHYSVFENKNLTRAHRNKIRRILGDMLHNEYISLKQYNQYLRYDYFEPNANTPQKAHRNLQRGVASHRKRSP